jgi:hypothetical protein
MTDMRGVISVGLQLVGGTVRHMPLANEVLPRLADVERTLVRTVRQHLDAVDPAPQTQLAIADEPAPPTTPALLLRGLLDRSMYTSPDDSRDALYLSLLQALVPDEARIFAALSDGSAYPLVHIAEPGVGSPVVILKNASNIGRAAGVSLPQHTPLYLTRLLDLGLAQPGPESSQMYDDYEMLLTDSKVSAALARARRGVRAARVIRQTVRITELGDELWEAAK